MWRRIRTVGYSGGRARGARGPEIMRTDNALPDLPGQSHRLESALSAFCQRSQPYGDSIVAAKGRRRRLGICTDRGPPLARLLLPSPSSTHLPLFSPSTAPFRLITHLDGAPHGTDASCGHPEQQPPHHRRRVGSRWASGKACKGLQQERARAARPAGPVLTGQLRRRSPAAGARAGPHVRCSPPRALLSQLGRTLQSVAQPSQCYAGALYYWYSRSSAKNLGDAASRQGSGSRPAGSAALHAQPILLTLGSL